MVRERRRVLERIIARRSAESVRERAQCSIPIKQLAGWRGARCASWIAARASGNSCRASGAEISAITAQSHARVSAVNSERELGRSGPSDERSQSEPQIHCECTENANPPPDGSVTQPALSKRRVHPGIHANKNFPARSLGNGEAKQRFSTSETLPGTKCGGRAPRETCGFGTGRGFRYGPSGPSRAADSCYDSSLP